MLHLFAGSSVSAVDARGRMEMPGFVRSTVERRTGTHTVILTAHQVDPCLAGYDMTSVRAVHADQERRLAAGPLSLQDHNAEVRRVFGLAEEVSYAKSGMLVLPAFLRSKGRICELALIVGTGSSFEIWDALVARQSKDSFLSELAVWRLEEHQQTARKEVTDVP